MTSSTMMRPRLAVAGCAVAAGLVVYSWRRWRRLTGRLEDVRRLPAVAATMNFGVGSHNTTGAAGASQAVTIYDGRGADFHLDTDGFTLRRALARGELYDAKATVAEFFPRVEAFLEELTGCGRALAFDHIVRNDARYARETAGGQQEPATKFLRKPLASAHGDYTARSGRTRATQLLAPYVSPEAIETVLAHRFAIVNVWCPFSTVQTSPLSMCSCRSSKPTDVRTQRITFSHRVGETYKVAFSPEQTWVYFSEMTAEECVAFKVFDSDETKAARFCLHSAFELPPTPGAPPPRTRESIEVRVLLLWGADGTFCPAFVPPHVVPGNKDANEVAAVLKQETLPVSDDW